MIDSGVLLILIGAMAILIVPVANVIAYRRWQRTALIGVTLRAAVPIAPPAPALDRLAVEADVALARDELLGGVAGVTEIYRRA